MAFMLDRPVVNFTRAVLDDAVEVNADFQAKAGLDVKIVRTPRGGLRAIGASALPAPMTMRMCVMGMMYGSVTWIVIARLCM